MKASALNSVLFMCCMLKPPDNGGFVMNHMWLRKMINSHFSNTELMTIVINNTSLWRLLNLMYLYCKLWSKCHHNREIVNPVKNRLPQKQMGQQKKECRSARGRFYTSARHVDLFWIRMLKPPDLDLSSLFSIFITSQKSRFVTEGIPEEDVFTGIC